MGAVIPPSGRFPGTQVRLSGRRARPRHKWLRESCEGIRVEEGTRPPQSAVDKKKSGGGLIIPTCHETGKGERFKLGKAKEDPLPPTRYTPFSSGIGERAALNCARMRASEKALLPAGWSLTWPAGARRRNGVGRHVAWFAGFWCARKKRPCRGLSGAWLEARWNAPTFVQRLFVFLADRRAGGRRGVSSSPR